MTQVTVTVGARPRTQAMRARYLRTGDFVWEELADRFSVVAHIQPAGNRFMASRTMRVSFDADGIVNPMHGDEVLHVAVNPGDAITWNRVRDRLSVGQPESHTMTGPQLHEVR